MELTLKEKIENVISRLDGEFGMADECIITEFGQHVLYHGRKRMVVLHVRFDEDIEDSGPDNPTEAGMYIFPSPAMLRKDKEFCDALRAFAFNSNCTEFEDNVRKWLSAQRNNTPYATHGNADTLVLHPQDLLDMWCDNNWESKFKFEQIK